MMNPIYVTKDYNEEELIGKLDFAPTKSAELAYDMLMKYPEAFTFGISYSVDGNGKTQLHGLSMIMKHGEKIPHISERNSE
jgi:hypothetical protein